MVPFLPDVRLGVFVWMAGKRWGAYVYKEVDVIGNGTHKNDDDNAKNSFIL